MNNTFDIPVLMVTFNRPAYAKHVFEKIKKLKPKNLFIFSDGPREGKPEEKTLVEECRKIFDNANFDWDCNVKKLFLEKNRGCGLGVSSAISWAFESVEKLIILEDDCVPHPSFFQFAETMLDRYQDDERVMHVAGTRWNEEFDTGNGDHFFSRIGHVWGWATWKRAWKFFDYKMQNWEKGRDRKMLKALLKERIITEYWVDCFVHAYTKNPTLNHAWDYQWQYAQFKNNGLAVVPTHNLVSNIGLQGVNSNESGSDKFPFNRISSNWEMSADEHPVTVNQNFDSYHIKNYFMRNATPVRKLKLFIKSFI